VGPSFHKEKGDPFEGIALESTGVVLGGDKQEKNKKTVTS
jgi:hypothetical protein